MTDVSSGAQPMLELQHTYKTLTHKKRGLSGSAKGNLGPFGARSRGVALPT
jgi:hypothetical protein